MKKYFLFFFRALKVLLVQVEIVDFRYTPTSFVATHTYKTSLVINVYLKANFFMFL